MMNSMSICETSPYTRWRLLFSVCGRFFVCEDVRPEIFESGPRLFFAVSTLVNRHIWTTKSAECLTHFELVVKGVDVVQDQRLPPGVLVFNRQSRPPAGLQTNMLLSNSKSFNSETSCLAMPTLRWLHAAISPLRGSDRRDAWQPSANLDGRNSMTASRLQARGQEPGTIRRLASTDVDQAGPRSVHLTVSVSGSCSFRLQGRWSMPQ